MPLTAVDEPGHYDFDTDNVYFFMTDGSKRVRCAITLQALEMLYPGPKRGAPTELACFDANRSRIERAAAAKFRMRYTEADGAVIVTSADL